MGMFISDFQFYGRDSKHGFFAPGRCFALLSAAVLCLLALIGCHKTHSEHIDLKERVDESELILVEFPMDEKVLRFGFELRTTAEEDAKQYLPFLRYLTQTTGYNIQLVFTAKDHVVGEDLGLGNLDFAALSSGSYLSTRKKHSIIPMALGLDHESKPEYRSSTVVAPDSPIQRLEDLQDKSVAFSNSLTNFSHLLPRICLFEHGISLSDLHSFESTESHLDCATAVSTGRVDAGIMQDTMAQRLAREGLVRIIHTSEPYPGSCLAGRPDLPDDVLAKIKQATLVFDPQDKHADGLYHWERTEMPHGFIAMEDSDYSILRSWAHKLSLLIEPARPGGAGS